jgi:coenzyme F420-reducing hydrogenase delta subunit
MAEAYGLPKPANLQMIKVPCAGKVDLDYMMNAFVEGADGLMIMACHAGNCKSERGNTYAKWRVEDLHRMMEEMGLEKERLEFVTLASNMGGGFSETLTGMEKKLKDLKK